MKKIIFTLLAAVMTLSASAQVIQIYKTTGGITSDVATYTNGTENYTYKAVLRNTAAAPLVQTITLNKTTLSLSPNGTETLSVYSVTPSEASTAVTWTSTASSIASVDGNGVVTGVAAGTATITATANDGSGVKGDCTVTVTKPNLLPYEFSVSSSKKVKFTVGNLYWDGSSAYHLEENQYDSPNNTTAGGTYSTSHVAHFFYSKTETISRAKSYSDGNRGKTDVFWCYENNKIEVDGTSDLYVLTNDEWAYLIGKTSGSRSTNLRKYNVTVAGKPCCLVIAPDNFTGTIADSYTAEEWETAESTSGLVCLPAAGYWSGLKFDNGGTLGHYWSATPDSSSLSNAYYLYFASSYVNTGSNGRNYGRSVRLVK